MCNLGAEKPKGSNFFQNLKSSHSNLAWYEVHYQSVDLASQLGHACSCKKCANKEGRPLVVLQKTYYS